jgi:imidazolonepropionase-like amidohydrolase
MARINKWGRLSVLAGLGLALAACETPGPQTNGSQTAGSSATREGKASTLPRGLDARNDFDSFPSTYKPLASKTTAIVGAHVLTATGVEYESANVIIDGGKIAAVGPNVAVPSGANVINGAGLWVTPGLIDAHSHAGTGHGYAIRALSNTNEATDPNTGQVWVEHSVWPQDPNFNRARAGGVTTLMVLPGSANLFGGRSVTLKNVPARNVQAMKFPGAPYGLKMACGENPKRVYGGKGRQPSTAMGNVAGYRKGWIEAADYARKWDDYRAKLSRGDKADAPKRDLMLDTLSGVLRGEILVQNHCYRADEMMVMIDIAKEFGFKISMFHHGSEAYKVADVLAREGICTATWGSWSSFKIESFDGIVENAPLLQNAGACAVIHSDDPTITQRLNQEASIAMAAGNRLGLSVTRAQAISWITSNPAKAIGVLDKTGTLEPGKAGDVVVWTADPFSVYATADKVFIDGALVFDAKDPKFQAKSDFELGQTSEGVR